MASRVYLPAVTVACYVKAHAVCDVPDCECPCHRKAEETPESLGSGA